MNIIFLPEKYRTQSYTNDVSFKRMIKPKKQSLYDLFVRTPVGYKNPKKSLDKILFIKPQFMAGTKCKGSIPLRNFWDFFYKNKNIKNMGYSTNKDGYGDSFLKAPSCMPISTSYVHDCSVMYLYDKISQTHAIYHALSDCTIDTINFMIKKLMPKGFTKGAIIPGDSFFYSDQEKNMKNMLRLMKNNSPKAIVNVYHSTCKYPEIVGIKGMVYQIPNTKVQEQIKSKKIDIKDDGQASFKVVDLQGYNTFQEIYDEAQTVESLKGLKKVFINSKYPKVMLNILLSEIDKRLKVLDNI